MGGNKGWAEIKGHYRKPWLKAKSSELEEIILKFRLPVNSFPPLSGRNQYGFKRAKKALTIKLNREERLISTTELNQFIVSISRKLF